MVGMGMTVMTMVTVTTTSVMTMTGTVGIMTAIVMSKMRVVWDGEDDAIQGADCPREN